MTRITTEIKQQDKGCKKSGKIQSQLTLGQPSVNSFARLPPMTVEHQALESGQPAHEESHLPTVHLCL
jgi:hypothetical protein